MRAVWFLLFGAVSGVMSEPTAEYTLTIDEKVNITLGTPNITFCKLYNNFGVKVYDNAGPCRLAVPKVTKEVEGEWRAQVSIDGRPLTELQTYSITMRARTEMYPILFTKPASNSVTLSCYFKVREEIQSCHFDSPKGDLVVISRDSQDGKYSFDEKTIPYFNLPNCPLKISNLTKEDFGIWRCAVKTPADTFYGFISLDEVSMEKNNGNDGVFLQDIDPVLKPLKQSIDRLMTDEGFTIGCKISAVIEHCFLRSPQGIVYSVGSGVTSTEYETVGEGLEAGVCAIRVFAANTNHSGTWNCTVGLSNLAFYYNPERSVTISVNVQALEISVKKTGSSIEIIVGIYQVLPESMLYCRFIRDDGFIISTRKGWIPGYSATTDFHGITCILTIEDADYLDYKKWIVSVKLSGVSQEFTKVIEMTDYNIWNVAGVGKSCIGSYIVHISIVILWLMSIALIVLTIATCGDKVRLDRLRRAELEEIYKLHEAIDCGQLADLKLK